MTTKQIAFKETENRNSPSTMSEQWMDLFLLGPPGLYKDQEYN